MPEFLLDSTNVHAWTDGSEIGGRAGYEVYFPHWEYGNISEPVVGPQTNNRAEVSAVRLGIHAVRNTQELCLYSDSKWCVDIFNNLQLYKRRAWMAQGKKPVKHHDVWEDILVLLHNRTAPVSMTHVYGHNKLIYNEATDALAKAGAARSTMHRVARPRGPAGGEPQATRQKLMRARRVNNADIKQ